MWIVIAIVLGSAFLAQVLAAARAIWYARSGRYALDQRLDAVSRRR